jgi:hypothetical protein
VHSEVQTPAIPEDFAAADAEARAIRLRHHKRLERAARWHRRDALLGAGAAAEWRLEDFLHRSADEFDADVDPAYFHTVADWIPHQR